MGDPESPCLTHLGRPRGGGLRASLSWAPIDGFNAKEAALIVLGPQKHVKQ